MAEVLMTNHQVPGVKSSCAPIIHCRANETWPETLQLAATQRRRSRSCFQPTQIDMIKPTSEVERQRLDRLEREMRENLKKRKALARAKAKQDVGDAKRLLDENGKA